MKKAIFPIICAILLPFIFSRANPDIEIVLLVLGALVGLAVGIGINSLVFRKSSS